MCSENCGPWIQFGETICLCAWPRDTLSVYVVHIIEDGTYETQVYYRSLTETGMDLNFSRYRDGERPKAITVIARRVSK